MVRIFRQVFAIEYIALWACLVVYTISAITIPGFVSGQNTLNILGVMLPLMILATGQTVVILTAGIDLSQMSTVAICGVCGAMIFSADGGLLAGSTMATPAGIAVMIAAGLLIGSVNGTCVAFFGMPAFIVTLVTMMLGSGVAVWLTQSQTASGFPGAYLALGKLFPAALLISFSLVIFTHLILSRSVYGSWLYAVGQNIHTSLVSGLPIRRILLGAYIFAGVCAAIAAILLTARLESASPVLGKRMILDVIGATVIGGTSLYGGRGKITWTFFGVAFLAIVDNSLNLAGASFAISMIAKGGIILAAATLDALNRRGGAHA